MAGNFAVNTDRFLGLHFSGSGETELLPGESPYMKNFKIIDGYKMLKRDGYRKIASPEGKCRGIWCGVLQGEEQLLAVFGDRLYRIGADGGAAEAGTVEGEGECSFLLFRDRLYILNRTKITVYFSGMVRELVPYRPLVAIATPPGGGGTPFEGVNRLTGQMRQSFTPDGTSHTFQVAFSALTSIDYISYNGRTLTGSEYSVNLAAGRVILAEKTTQGFFCGEIPTSRISVIIRILQTVCRALNIFRKTTFPRSATERKSPRLSGSMTGS